MAWKEFTIKENKDEIAAYCSDFEVVAFSCYIWNISPTLEVCKKIKTIKPNIKILLGGPEVSYEWEDLIALEEVDFIIQGEGEIAFAEFLKHYPDVALVPSLIWKKNKEVIENPLAPMFDLKQLEHIMPYGDDVAEELKNKVLYLETSRGCPYKCEFCLASLDNKVRQLPMQSIKNTLLFMMQHGRVVKFLDRTFNVKKDFSIEIFQFILDHHREGNVFQFEITADILHPDIRKFIHEKVPKGLFRFEIGIQTVNQKANLEVQRKQNFDKTKAIIQELEYKVEMHLDLIVGMALDHWPDIKYSFEEVFKLEAPELQLGFLKFLKGTPVRQKYKEHGFVFDPEPPYQIIESKYLSKTELERITKLEHALEIYWNSGKAQNLLRYVNTKYSSFDFLLGLGEYFGTQRTYHKYSLNDVFEIATTFVEQHYPEDRVLKEFIALDYYLHFKVKPQLLFLNEIERAEKNALVEQLGLNPHKYRYLILPLSFDFEGFLKTRSIQSGDYRLVIEYNGLTKCRVLKAMKQMVV
ncbi:MAG: B12-binding domain-containing radical SAM protein [Bacteroidia bacterium]|nr:B12-binding domain-containing radical SAM protein [Bacteroidia bacterium]